MDGTVSDRWGGLDNEIKRHFVALQQRMIELGMSQSWPSREIPGELLSVTETQEQSQAPEPGSSSLQGFKLQMPQQSGMLESSQSLLPANVIASTIKDANASFTPLNRQPLSCRSPEPAAAEEESTEEHLETSKDNRDETLEMAVIWGQSLEEQPQDKPLNSSQRSRLAKCERIIEKGLGTFVVMGKALAQIRNERLYRETHPTFEAYCQQRWALTARRARQLTDAAEIVRNLEGSAEDETSDTMGTIVPIVTPDKRVACCVLPTSERQVRPLSRLGYRQQREVWQKAVEASQGVPSEQQVEKIRDAMFPQSKSKPKKAPSQKREVEEEQEPMGAQVPLDNSAEVHQEPVEPKPYQPLLDFLQDLKANPGNYDFDISIDDHELMTSYGQVRARLLRLIEALELAVT